MVYLLAQLTCRASSHPESTEAAKAMITATRAEPGCILYDLNISITDALQRQAADAEALAETAALGEALAGCGEWCGVPNPDCRQYAIPACYAYQISANTKQKQSLT